jgi:hypothetical protein
LATRPKRLFHAIVACGVTITACGTAPTTGGDASTDASLDGSDADAALVSEVDAADDGQPEADAFDPPDVLEADAYYCCPIN